MPANFERARKKYKPNCIKYLLIAESPPPAESGRFFYFEEVRNHDSLFLEMMKVLYPDDYKSVRYVRENKKAFLNKFMKDGFYLIDSTDSPIINARNKDEKIRAGLPYLKRKINRLVSNDTRIILISRSVYDVCFHALRNNNYNVINIEMIDFPGSRWQIRFRDKMSRLLNL